MIDLAAVRRNMVDTQLRTYDVNSKRVLDAVEDVARERYLPPGMTDLAYADQTIAWPLPEGGARILLQPMVLARMIQAADPAPGQKALCVAGAAGYGAALLAAMGLSTTLLESSEAMAAEARRALAADGAGSVRVMAGALQEGDPNGGPYDVILVEGAVDVEPTALLAQLTDGGRLVAVVGGGPGGRVVVHQRSGESVGRRSVFDAAAAVLPEFRAAPAFRF